MLTEQLIIFTTSVISSLGYTGLAILTALESLFVPVPPEITVVFSGFLAYSGKFNLFYVILFATLGAITGSTIAYWIGFHFKKGIAEKLIQKHGHFLFFTREELENIKRLFDKHGYWFIIISRFIPGLRSIVSLPMGILEVPFFKFFKYTLIGAVISTSAHAYAGYLLGNKWDKVRQYLHKFDIYILLLSSALVLFYFYRRSRKKLPNPK